LPLNHETLIAFLIWIKHKLLTNKNLYQNHKEYHHHQAKADFQPQEIDASLLPGLGLIVVITLEFGDPFKHSQIP
jgi:hypothetical protein